METRTGEQDPFIGRCFVGRRYMRENRLYRVLGTYMPGYTAKHVYRCETLDYDGDYAVKVEYDHIEMETAKDFFIQEITHEQYIRGIELFYKSLAKIHEYVNSMKGIPCDHMQIGKAYRSFGDLYYNLNQNPKDLLVSCENIKIESSSITLNNSWIPLNLVMNNRIGYEEIEANDAQKAIKQFQFLHATVRSYIDALAKDE
jgi:hypothetical protein